MERVGLDELKKIQLEILDYAADYCDRNNIEYFLDSGTLLGAIRHKGYIPWDDDIDIGMLRPSYDIFLSEFNKSNDRYKVYSIENNKAFYYPHAKILDTHTVLFEPDEKGTKLNINIDIFIYDNAPDDDELVKKMFDKRDYYRKLNLLRTFNAPVNGGLIPRIIKKTKRVLVSPFKKSYFCEKMMENSRKYANVDTKRVGNFSAYTRQVCDRHVFDEYVLVEFEGKLYKAPSGYDEWLHSFYGDYMQLPPVEKRVSHHSFIAYK